MFLQLAQQSETIGILQTVLDGGLPLMLLVALCIVGYLYKKEKDAKDAVVTASMTNTEAHSAAISNLKTDYSKKVEELLRERIESETEMQKALMETREIMKSTVMTMNNCNETLESLIEE